MYYSFNTSLALKYGVNEAIMLNNFIFWIAKNEANNKHFHDGRYWTYNTIAAFEKIFPFWTINQIRTVISSLVKQGVLLKGNYNELKYDRTVWYAFSDEFNKWICENSQMDFGESANGDAINHEPIPYIKPDIETHIDSSSTRPARQAVPQAKKRFSYRDALIAEGVQPENVDRLLANRKSNNLKNTEAAFNKLKGAAEQVCNARGVTFDEAVEFASKKGWGFIDPSWNLEGLTAHARRSKSVLSLNDYINREFNK